MGSMKNNMASTEPHLKVVARPSLYTSESPGMTTEKPASILASLEPDRTRLSTSRTWLFSLALIVLAAGISYWAYVSAIFQKPIAVPAWVETALNISKEPAQVVHRTEQPIVARLDKPVEARTEESQAATIVTEPVPPSGMQTVATSTETPGVVAAPNNETAAKKSTEPLASATVASSEAKPPVAQKTDTKESAAHESAPAAKPANRVAEKAHPRQHVKSGASKKGKDDDVNLIAALLARVSPHAEAAGKQGGHKRTVASPSHAGTVGQNQIASNRDVVIRSDGDTTESLLKRCKSLGFFEGELCRIRICSSLWGKDPACPATEQVASPNPN